MADNTPDKNEPPAKGSLIAPLIPRSYVAGADMIVPGFLKYARPLFISFAVLFNLYVSVQEETTGVIALTLMLVTTVLHFLALAYSVRVALLYIREMSIGGEIYSQRSANAVKVLPVSLILAVSISVGAYIWAAVLYFQNLPGWLVVGLIAFMLENLWMMKARVDTLSMFLGEYFVSGLYRVRYDSIGDLRIASSAMPGINTKAERRIYFELYDNNGEYFGRDSMYEGDYLHLEKKIKGEVRSHKSLFATLPKEDAPDSSVRHAAKKKKKNPYKKK